MRRYNLIDEKWIPVRMLDGRHDTLGIAEILLRAKEIASIENASPLIVASLHRFLLALLYRAIEGPTDFEHAKILFKEGFPKEKIKSYLEKWHERFWLFDENYPFFQIPTFEPREWRAWTTLFAENNADNAKVLFDHIDVGRPGGIPEAKAACGILATQTFALSCGKSELSHTGTAPSATAVMVLPIGSNLEETLLFSLIDENREILKRDVPIWERDPETINSLKSGQAREINGIADLYTWRSRSIRLKSDLVDGIENVAFASGVNYTKTELVDPMLAYRSDDKHGRLPILFGERGLWRDFDSLLPDDSKLGPQVIEHAIRLTRHIPQRFPQSILVLGQSNNKAKVEFWRMERFVIPKALIGEKMIRSDIKRLLDIAKDMQSILWRVCQTFATHLLSHGERKPEKKDINSFIKQMACEDLYWSTMEAQFHSVLESFTLEKDYDEIELGWRDAVKNALTNSWNQHKASVSYTDAWELRAIVKADYLLIRELQKNSNSTKNAHKESR